MRGAYRQFTVISGTVIALVGIVMVALTIERGGGPLALGVLVGAGLALFGASRVLLARDAG